MSRYAGRSKAERLIRLPYLLREHPRGLTILEMAARCGVCAKTIRRDLVALEAAGVRLTHEGPRYMLAEGADLPPITLRLEEATWLYLAARLLDRYSDQRSARLIAALGKLADALPPPITRHIRQSAQVVAGKPPQPTFDAVFDVVAGAWASGYKVRIWHRAGDSANVHDYVVCPYFLEPAAEGYALYLIGHSTYFDAVTTFKMERIQRAERLAETFALPAQFDGPRLLDSAWNVAFGEGLTVVRLRFASGVTRRVKESVWHPSQRIEDCADGGCVVTFRVHAPWEMKPWLRGWGPDCECLAPQELRAEIATEARRAAELYVGEEGEG